MSDTNQNPEPWRESSALPPTVHPLPPMSVTPKCGEPSEDEGPARYCGLNLGHGGSHSWAALAGLDFAAAERDGLVMKDGRWVRDYLLVEAALQAQHAALLADAVEQARREERENDVLAPVLREVTEERDRLKRDNAELNAGLDRACGTIVLLRKQVAPLFAAVAEFQRTYRLTHGTSFPSDEDANAYAEARRNLAALPLPPEMP